MRAGNDLFLVEVGDRRNAEVLREEAFLAARCTTDSREVRPLGVTASSASSGSSSIAHLTRSESET